MSELFPARSIAVEVLSCTDASQEYEFNHWYNTVNIPYLRQIPGIADVFRYREMALNLGEMGVKFVAPAGQPPRYLTLYRININVDDPWALMQRVKRDHEKRAVQGKIIGCLKSYELTVWDFIVYRRTVSALERPETHLPDGMPETLFAGTNSCDPTREDEFNDWYLHTHLHDILETPGYVQASRFRSLNPRPARNEARYLVLYEVDSVDPPAVLRRILETDRDVRRPQGRMSSALRQTAVADIGGYCRGLFQHVDI